MKEILRKITPKHIRNYLHYKWFTLFLLGHENDISELGKKEIEYSLNYAKLFKQYGRFFKSLSYNDNETIAPTRIIWWCWLQGEEQAPLLCKACLASLRRNLPQFEVKVVTEQNMFDYIHPPKHIIEKYQEGIISRTHFSDILRTLLLIEHGGVWIDSTVYCTGYNIPIFDYPLFVYQNWKFNIPQTMVASSWLISARKNDPILCATRDLLFEYWKDHDTLQHYYVYHFFFQMAANHYASLWKAVPRYSNIPPHILQFELFEQYNDDRFRQIKSMSDFHKLSWKYNVNKMSLTGTNWEYIIKNS